AHSKSRRTRAQSTVPRLGPRFLLVVLQPAVAAARVHVRLQVRPRRAASKGNRTVRAISVLRPPAVDLVFLVADRIGQRAHRRRESDQEGVVSGRGAADRHGARQPRALLLRSADSGGLSDLLQTTVVARRAG